MSKKYKSFGFWINKKLSGCPFNPSYLFQKMIRYSKKSAELTHNMYQITYTLPESKHTKFRLLKMDDQQAELYQIISKNPNAENRKEQVEQIAFASTLRVLQGKQWISSHLGEQYLFGADTEE